MAAFPEDIASSRLKHSGGDKNLIPEFGLWGRLEGTRWEARVTRLSHPSGSTTGGTMNTDKFLPTGHCKIPVHLRVDGGP